MARRVPTCSAMRNPQTSSGITRPSAPSAPRPYVPREPEVGPLVRLLREHLDDFIARCDDDRHRLPRFVERQLRAIIPCGDPCFGFVRLECTACRGPRPVLLQGPHLSFCAGRRMNEQAAHLVDRVLPACDEVPPTELVRLLAQNQPPERRPAPKKPLCARSPGGLELHAEGPPGARAPLPRPQPSTDSTRQTRAPRRRQARALAQAHLEGKSQGRRLRTPRPHRPPRGAPAPYLQHRTTIYAPSSSRHLPSTALFPSPPSAPSV